jgi:hypothetical protein
MAVPGGRAIKLANLGEEPRLRASAKLAAGDRAHEYLCPPPKNDNMPF